jgi:prepilin signal peptidase PulO-like enzyme (type II secretory pathway)
MEWSYAFIFFLTGTVIGRFLNVIIDRLPQGQPLFTRRLDCPHCGAAYPLWYPIPLPGIDRNGGRCEQCREKFPVRYPFVESLNGIWWGWSFGTLPAGEAVIAAALGSLLLPVAWIDAHTLSVPLNLILLALAVVLGGIVFQVLSWSSALWGIVVGVVVPAAIMGIGYLLTGRQGMGFGDLQLGLVLGLWLGPLLMAITIFLAALFGLILWLIISLRAGFDRDRPLPFAPFLVTVGLLVFTVSVYRGELFEKLLFW